MKKTVIFLIFADIKGHNFKYFGQFLIKFGHNNIGFLGFGMHSILFENLSPLKTHFTYRYTPKKFVDRKKLFNPFWIIVA